MSFVYAVTFWLLLVLYALLVAGSIYAHVFQKPRLGAWARRGVWPGLALHTALVAWRWIETGHVPAIGNFENALVGGWFIVILTAYFGWRDRLASIATATLPFALVIMGWGGMSETDPSPLVASLKSFWLYIHIFFAWLAYGGYTVACGAGIVYLVKERRGGEAARPLLARIDELMVRATVFGFITDAIMIAAGSIWARDLWGSYWSWDPVETWSLLSWLIYGVALHLRATFGWRGRRVAYLTIVAIVTVLVSFWGVGYLQQSTYHLFNVD